MSSINVRNQWHKLGTQRPDLFTGKAASDHLPLLDACETPNYNQQPEPPLRPPYLPINSVIITEANAVKPSRRLNSYSRERKRTQTGTWPTRVLTLIVIISIIKWEIFNTGRGVRPFPNRKCSVEFARVTGPSMPICAVSNGTCMTYPPILDGRHEQRKGTSCTPHAHTHTMFASHQRWLAPLNNF